jgi:hypothetical protein
MMRGRKKSTGQKAIRCNVGTAQLSVPAHAKDATIRQLFRRGNNVKVKESQFSRVPILDRIDLGASQFVRHHGFDKQTLVPAPVDVPMLHRVRNVRGLDD